MIESTQWRLPVRRVDTANLRGIDAPEGTMWSKEMTVERYSDKLFGGIGCIEYGVGGRFLALSSRGQSLVLRLPLRAQDANANTSNCVWNEQLPRSCFTTRLRQDEKLAVQTVEKRVIVRSTETAFERVFDGHTRDVRDALFLTNQIVASVSDDATVRLWSLTQTNEVAISAGTHTDYVRTACAFSDRQFATGGYDKMIHMWDVRSDMRSPVASFGMAQPIEKIVCCYNPNNTSSNNNNKNEYLLFAAAADVVAIFDIRKGGAGEGASSSSSSSEQQQHQKQRQTAMLSSASFHTKTVAALAVSSSTSSSSSSAVTVLSGGFDKRIKVHRMSPDGSLQTIASRKANSAVTALAVHPDGNQFAVGTSDGYASAFDVSSALQSPSAAAATGQSDDGELVHADRGVANQGQPGKSTIQESAAAVRKEKAVGTWLRRIHALLARFRYGLALKTALFSNFPDVIVSTLDELQRRCALHVALNGHNDRTIVQLLRFASEKVSDPKLTHTCLTVLDRIFEIYAPVAASSEYFLRELLRCHHLLDELNADVEHIRASTAVLELLATSQ